MSVSCAGELRWLWDRGEGSKNGAPIFFPDRWLFLHVRVRGCFSPIDYGASLNLECSYVDQSKVVALSVLSKRNKPLFLDLFRIEHTHGELRRDQRAVPATTDRAPARLPFKAPQQIKTLRVQNRMLPLS